MSRNILVTGAKGQLGSELNAAFKSTGEKVFFTDVEELDITDIKSVRTFVSENEIGAIINCAAFTAVDRAEEQEELANLINNGAVENLAVVAKEFDCKFVHISTDYVFDGTNYLPYDEDYCTAPIGVYGKTKLAGENAVIRSGCKYVIIRTSWLYSTFGNNFVKTIIKNAKVKGELKVIADQIGTPTNAHDLALAIIEVLRYEGWHNGIYHYSNEGVCSWFDFAKAIVDIAKIDCVITACSTNEYPTLAARPHYSVLNKSKIKHTFGIKVPYWRDSLISCINSFEN